MNPHGIHVVVHAVVLLCFEMPVNGIFLHGSSVKHRLIRGTGKRRLFHECYIPYSQEFIEMDECIALHEDIRQPARIAMESVAYTGIINELIILYELKG